MRMDAEIRVYVERRDFGRDLYVAIVLEAGIMLKVAKVVEGGRLEFVDQQDGMYIPPTILISTHMAKQLLAGLLELNIPSPSAGAIEGELKATKVHLEDLRTLLHLDAMNNLPPLGSAPCPS